MELEEAVKTTRNFIDYFNKNKCDGNKANLEVLGEEKEAIETVLNHITKQDKMIELMAEHISFGKDIQKILCSPKVHGKDDCIGITCKRCIKQYFEKKAEED